jgi:uncharacterized protein with PIN domain
MLGGLARWLRAAGYDASWQEGIDDRELVRLARQEGRLLLSSDSQVFQFAVIRDGHQPALFIPLHSGPQQQLGHVLESLHLPLREPRCMACGGALVEVPREQAADRVPPRTYAWLEQFWECDRCGRILWQGTHWQRIAAALRRATTGPP